MKIFGCLIALLLSMEVLQATHQPYFRHYTIQDGLPSMEVYQSRQDDLGFMWFATDRGVVRFDGKQFELFNRETGLQDEVVFMLTKDQHNRMWMGSYRGGIFYCENDSVYPHPQNDTLKQLLHNQVINDLVIDPFDTLWIATQHSITLKVAPNGEITSLGPEKTGIGRAFVKEISRGDLLVGRYHRNGQIEHYRLEMAYPGGVLDTILPIERASIRYTLDAVDWPGFGRVFCQGHKMVFAGKGGTRVMFYKTDFSNSLFVDGQNRLWAGSFDNGVRLFENGDITNPVRTYLPGVVVTSVFEDREGGYWFTTQDAGIFYCPNLDLSIDEFENLFDGDDLLSLYSNGERLYAGTSTGRVLWIQGDTAQPVLNEKVPWGVVGMNEAPNGDLLLSTYRSMFRCTPEGCIQFEGSHGFFIICRNDTIWSLSSLKTVIIAPSESYWINDFKVECALLWQAPNGNLEILAGRRKGLMVLKGTEVEPFPVGHQYLESGVSCMDQDPDGRLWVGTFQNGLLRLENDRFEAISWNAASYLPNLRVLYAEKPDRLWLGTKRGLARLIITPKGGTQLYHFLPQAEIKQIVSHKGEIWALTPASLIRINPNKDFAKHVKTPIYIRELIINGNGRTIDSAMVLPPSTRSISIQFIAPTFNRPGPVQYRYRMRGIDSQWTHTQSNRVEYPNLPDGEYRFEVQVQNRDGSWTEQAQPVAFEILPPFWKTWWFIALCSIALLSMVWLGFYIRFNTLAKQATLEKKALRLERKYLEAEQKALAAQMNPHFIFNSINSIQMLIADGERKRALESMNMFSRLMRKTLRHTREQFITLNDEIEALKLYLDLELLRFDNKFDYTIEMGSKLKPEGIEIPSMLIQPYVENAIWHGLLHKTDGRGRIVIRLEERGDFLLCSVSDNGIGREAAAKFTANRHKDHKSTALEIGRERLRHFREEVEGGSDINVKFIDLRAEDGSPTGTQVEIVIPIVF